MAKKKYLTKKPKITVIMPAYNVAKYIAQAIESVLSQDYEKFELIMLDDGSNDNTFNVMKKYENDPRIKIYRNKKNQGVGAARNKLLRLAMGEYISPCDADDVMLPNNLKTLSNFLDKHKKIGVVYADLLVVEVDKNDKIIKPFYIEGTDCNKKWDLVEPCSLVNHPGSMIRKSLIFKCGGYDETVYSKDDHALFLKLTEITQFQYLKGEVYYLRRRHPSSLTKTVTLKRLHADMLKIKKEAIKRRYNFDFKY